MRRRGRREAAAVLREVPEDRSGYVRLQTTRPRDRRRAKRIRAEPRQISPRRRSLRTPAGAAPAAAAPNGLPGETEFRDRPGREKPDRSPRGRRRNQAIRTRRLCGPRTESPDSLRSGGCRENRRPDPWRAAVRPAGTPGRKRFAIPRRQAPGWSRRAQLITEE